MSRRKRNNAAPAQPSKNSQARSGRGDGEPVGSGLSHHPANPPKPRRGFLIAAVALLMLWMAALLAMAICYGSFRPGN
jgi:hypothetical protein